MQYEMIAAGDAPPPGPERRKRRLPEVEALIGELGPDAVAKVSLGEDEKPRPIMEHLYRSAARHGKAIEVWESGGHLYVELGTAGSD